MLVEVKVPMLAESVAEATLMQWHKKPGDVVKRGDSLIDIETDKVTLEVAAPNNGVLTEILRQDGEDVDSNEVIARIETDVQAASTTELPAAEEAADTTAATQTKEPVQQTLPVLEEEQAIPEEPPQLSPAVRNMIENYDLNPEEIQDLDHDGRITKEDVLQHLKTMEEPAAGEVTAELQEVPEPTESSTPEPVTPFPIATPPPAPTPESEPSAVAEPSSDRPERRVPMTRLRQRIAERLLSAQHENALLTTFNEVNMQPVMDLRQRYKEEFEQTHGVRLGFMSFFTKAVIEALKQFPIINASVDGNDIIYHDYYDIGIAVSSPRGLVVPILRDADNMSLAQIETTIRDMGERAQDAKLTLDELTGGSFTITNGGVFGSLLSTPIINPPQSAILGMHKIQERPVAENGQVMIRPMMYLALSYDHRIIDGKEAVQFLVTIKERLEDPSRLLLQI